MAKVILDAPFRKIKGKIGKLSYRWMYGQQTVMKTPDMSKVKWSKAQNANRQRFKAAIAYAKAAMADPHARTIYEKQAAEQNRKPFRVAVSDYLKGVDLLAGK